MTLIAGDLMQTHVVSVGSGTPLTDVTRLFVEEEISGAPVVDETGRILGVISVTDILRVVNREHDSPSNDPTYFRESLEFSAPDYLATGADFQDRLSELTVADAMQGTIVSVRRETPISEVAKLLRVNRIHRVLVVNGESLVGILSTFDLIAQLEAEAR